MSTPCFFLSVLILLQFHRSNTDCVYTVSKFSFLASHTEQCNSFNWGAISSMSKHCDKHLGWMYYKLYYDKGCPRDETKYHTQNSSIRCYIDANINCKSIEIIKHEMFYETNTTTECLYDDWDEYFGDHWIYDSCLFNPHSTQYPYIKGEYNTGHYRLACVYKINYYTDAQCKNKIGSKLFDPDRCIDDSDGVPFTFSYPDCYAQLNILTITGWVVVAVMCLCVCQDVLRRSPGFRELPISKCSCLFLSVYTIFCIGIATYNLILDHNDLCKFDQNDLCDDEEPIKLAKKCSTDCTNIYYTSVFGYILAIIGIWGIGYILMRMKRAAA